ncbi:ABC transporter permease [Ferriphaselus sp. R-1]|uniref:ABC transporter permease n=1 Tax=Ferriphaselus sp. R-1 TaxID=1485544 RepID=UPI00054DF6F3|nr:ABC transporter permease [Ferriphaselus sp. R-1]
MMPVVLLTDAMVYLLLAVGVAGALWVRRHPHLLLPWQRVARNGVGMASLIVLALFLLVGFLDSLHYRAAMPDRNNGHAVYSPEVLSAFDAAVGELRSRTEKTYSAPLAAYLYARETHESEDGKVLRDYPRLKFGGAHLADPQRDWAGDVLKRALLGGGLGALAGGMLILAFRRCAPMRRHGPMAVLLLAGVVIGSVASLAQVYHVLGTDKVGQDVLYLSLKSIRTGLVIGTVTTLVMLPFALFLGVAAGYLRGWVDDVIQYVYTVLSSIPSVLLIAAAVLMMQLVIEQHADWFNTAAARADVRLLCLCLILGVTSWTGLCRLLRGETLKLREQEYIQAAQAFGVSSFRILTRHIVPNVMHIVLISVVMDFSGLVLAEAVLSYVGVGVDPATISFGTMINAARMEMGREPMVWWTLASAFSFMLVLVLAANLFADAVRDAFDPRLNRSS